MALRAELIGPYCLFLVTSSVCADLVAVRATVHRFDGANDSAENDCGCPRVGIWQHVSPGSRVIGQQLTAESELARTPGIRLSN